MSNQKKISSFFNTASTKRRADNADVNTDLPQSKSSRTEDPSSPESNANRPLSNLSPEQRERMEANRKAAGKRLLGNKSPQFFGDSWRTALAAEFNKEYFVKVCLIGVQYKMFTIESSTLDITENKLVFCLFLSSADEFC